ALQTIVDRDFIPSIADDGLVEQPVGSVPAPIEANPTMVTELIERNQASVAALQRDIRTKSGTDLIDFILTDIQELKRILLDPQNMPVIMAGMDATWWLNDQLLAWLGE